MELKDFNKIFITDGFGNYWDIKCPICGNDSMIVIRPGKAVCSECDNKEELNNGKI